VQVGVNAMELSLMSLLPARNLRSTGPRRLHDRHVDLRQSIAYVTTVAPQRPSHPRKSVPKR